MTPDQLLDFSAFAVVTSVTPGPNNMLLTASGLGFGFRRAVPQIIGIVVGVMVMTLAVGFGLGTVFQTLPIIQTLMKLAAILYLSHLVWGLARADGIEGAAGLSRPIRFIEAALFQWINPKAWLIMVSAVALYTPVEGFFTNLVTIATLIGLISVMSASLWAGFGRFMRQLLRSRLRIRLFNLTMAALLAATIVPLLFEIGADLIR